MIVRNLRSALMRYSAPIGKPMRSSQAPERRISGTSRRAVRGRSPARGRSRRAVTLRQLDGRRMRVAEVVDGRCARWYAGAIQGPDRPPKRPCHRLSQSLRGSEQCVELCPQRRQVGFDDAPNDPVVQRCISMDDDVSEPDDAIDVADSRSCLSIDATQSIQRLANDLELSLHSGAKKLITFIVWKRLPCGEPSDALGGFLRIPQQLVRVSVHTPACARDRHARESMDSRGSRQSAGRPGGQTALRGFP